MARTGWSAVLVGTIVLAGLGAIGLARMKSAIVEAHGVLPTYGQVPQFALADQDGQPISREALQGQVWIADFIFTRCAGQCPMMTAEMARLSRLFHAQESVTLVSFSVDPEWDTPPVLARYAKTYGAAREQWVFATGDRDQITRLCQEGFRLALADQPGTDAEPITHSTRLVLVDRAGRIRGYYDAADAGALQQLPRDVRALLKETPS